MSINFKDSVRIKVLLPCLYNIFPIIDEVWKDTAGKIPTVTSCNDSTHMKGSLHYSDRALDLRSKDLSELEKETIFNTLKTKLNPIGYDVIFEGKGVINEHFHIEYDPK
jgi:hypothetical protein